MSMDEIQAEVTKMEKESKALKEELFRFAWFMRGAVTLEQAYQLDLQDREIIAEIVKYNLETTKNSGLPFY